MCSNISKQISVVRCYSCIGLLVFIILVDAKQYPTCEKQATIASLQDRHSIAETTLKLLIGTWFSEGCETRPGPEYVIRVYTFEDNGRFNLIQHHYWDDSCSSPRLSLFSHGRIQLRNSLIQPGASIGFPKFANITVVPQDEDAAENLNRLVASECPGQYWKSWRRYEEHNVYENKHIDQRQVFNLWSSSYDTAGTGYNSPNSQQGVLHSSGHLNCLGSLKWAFNELKLMKILLRPTSESLSKRVKHMKMELFLGDIHSNFIQRELYTPTSFQAPLVKQANDDLIAINKHSYVIKYLNNIPSNIFIKGKAPPHLLEKPHLPPYIWGEWTSIRCETRPMGLYLTRRFSIYSSDSAWIGEHTFYADPFCSLLKFIVTAAGHFKLVGPSEELKGVANIDFHIEKASLTVTDKTVIYDMRLPGLCGRNNWEINVPKELSSTGGCAPLGIVLPSVLHDVAKIEIDFQGSCLLFLGQADTNIFPTILKDRPTAFQSPLIRCGEVATYSRELRDILNDNFYSSTANRCRLNSIWILGLSLVLINFKQLSG